MADGNQLFVLTLLSGLLGGKGKKEGTFPYSLVIGERSRGLGLLHLCWRESEVSE